MPPLAPYLMHSVRRFRRSLRDRLRGETAETYFDLHDPAELNAELLAYDVDPLTADPREAEESPAGAARFILGLLARHPHLRRSFPMALSDGANGAFARWLTGPGAAEHYLSPLMVANILAAFAEPPCEPVKRIYEVRTDLREVYPFALTPRQRRQYLAWLLAHGRRDLGITAEGALWFLFEIDESPDRGLIPSYLVQPAWQEAVPHALTVYGWPAFVDYLRRTHGLSGRWLNQARWRPTLRPCDELKLLGDRPQIALPPRAWIHGLHADQDAGLPAKCGVNLLGHFRYASGLQEACVGVGTALEGQGVRVMRRDLPVNFPADWSDRERYQSLEVHDTTIYVAAVNTFPKEYCQRSGLYMRPGVRRIAVWYWEVDRLPPEWEPDLTWADEVWAPTRFLAEAYRRHVRVPVIPMLPGVALPPFAAKPRDAFCLPADKFLFLFAFDMGSVMARKNPLGLIAAFRRAFRTDDNIHLVIKVSRSESNPVGRAALIDACRSIGATLIDRVLTRADTLALFATADCYVSLHRAEGLGLSLAESMLMGKPVVATAYSGNLDFMTPTNSYLVNAKPVPIIDTPPYPPGSVWAEPDLDHAAAQLRAVFDHRNDARSIGQQAKSDVQATLSLEAAGRRMVERLHMLEAGAKR